MAEEKRIGIFTTEERFHGFAKLFEEHADMYTSRLDLESAENPDYIGTLTKWDRNGYDVAIVDDMSLKDKDDDRFIAEVTAFYNNPRIKAAHLRVIFFSSTNRTWDDSVVAALLRNGAYDVVLPAKDKEPIATLVDLVKFARKRSDILAMLPKDNNIVLRISQDEETVAKPKVKQDILHEERVRRLARGQSIIAVSATRPYAGATHCAIALARTLVILGQEPAVVLNSKTFQSFITSYDVNLTRGDRCVINGIVFFDGGEEPDSSCVPWTKHTHIILDIGYFSWSKQTNDHMKKAYESFNNADRQVVYVPAGNPHDITYLRQFIRARNKSLNRYALAFYGCTTPIYDKLADEIKSIAENAYIWQMPYTPWVLSMTKTQYLEHEDVLFNALRQVLPRATVEDFDARKNAETEVAEPAEEKPKKSKFSFFSKKEK